MTKELQTSLYNIRVVYCSVSVQLCKVLQVCSVVLNIVVRKNQENERY